MLSRAERIIVLTWKLVGQFSGSKSQQSRVLIKFGRICTTRNMSTTSEKANIPLQKDVVSNYLDCSATPIPVSGHLNEVGAVMTAVTKWSLTDAVQEKKICFETTHVAVDGIHFQPLSDPREVNESASMSVSSGGTQNLRAVIKEISKGDKKVEFVEIWNSKGRIGVYDVEKSALHGKILTKGPMVCLEWSADERMILFCAEKKTPKAESFFVAKPSPDGETGTVYKWKEDWGEQIEGCSSPVVAVLSVEDMSCEVVSMPDQDVSLGQATFTPDGSGVVLISMTNTPYRLGAIFCNNRESHLYHYDLSSKKFTELAEQKKCIYSPRFNGRGDMLLYMENAVGGPHQMGCKMIKIDWNSKQTHLLVDAQQKPLENDFPGLYCTSLQKNSMSGDGKRAYIAALWHSKSIIVSVDLETGKVTNITPDETYGSWQLFSIKGSCILAARSSPSIFPHLVVGRVQDAGDVTWAPIGDVVRLPEIKWDILKLRPKLHQEYFYEAIYIRLKSKNHPLIVYPHGGPHSASTARYSTEVHFFLKCGFGVLLVNYRGSIGFGEHNLFSLPGNVGNFDVKDVQQAVEEAIAMGEADPKKVVLNGASHGGFLGAHLAGQYPSFYTACCLLNPVIDFSMAGPSDIPDWYMYEAGCEGIFNHASLPTDSDLAKMREKSPIAHAHKITTPCFFFLGSGDLRVDKGQGLRLYKHLKARQVPARCNMYEDNHSLSKIQHDSDVSVNTVLWFYQYVK